jgi:hypothetical protein
VLEREVEKLRTFEREYRSRLKSYLETQLRELEGRDTAAPAGQGQRASGASAPAGQPGQPAQPVSGGHAGPPAGSSDGGAARNPFASGPAVGHQGGDGPSGPPQQAQTGYTLEEGPEPRG